jgi:hypothetical protein
MNKHYFVQFYDANSHRVGTRSLISSTNNEAHREAQALLLNSTAVAVEVWASIAGCVYNAYVAYVIDRQTGSAFGPHYAAMMKAEATEAKRGNAPCACDHPGDVPAWMRGEQMELD